MKKALIPILCCVSTLCQAQNDSVFIRSAIDPRTDTDFYNDFNPFSSVQDDQIAIFQRLGEYERADTSRIGYGLTAWYQSEKIWVVGQEETMVLVPRAVIFGTEIYRLIRKRSVYQYAPESEISRTPPP